MRLVVLLALGLFACRSDRGPSSQQTAAPAHAEAGPAGAPSTLPGAPASAQDPWAVAPKPASADDPPDLAARHKLAEAACPSVTGPYFFEIKKNGKTSWILGTRHLGVPLTKFPAPVQDAIAAAKLAVFEVAPDDDADMPEEKVVLPDVLGPALWKHYQELVGADTAQALESSAPAVAMLAMMAMYEDIGATLDTEIQHKVIAAHVPTRGLETSAFQDKLLNKILDLRMLKASIEQTKDRKELASESHDDLAQYCAGTDDTAGMDDDMRKDLLAAHYTEAELAKIDEEMVYARNADWIPKLEKLFTTDHVFIAVGADHLIGDRGVVALLKKRGYTVTRITK